MQHILQHVSSTDVLPINDSYPAANLPYVREQLYLKNTHGEFFIFFLPQSKMALIHDMDANADVANLTVTRSNEVTTT